MTNGENNEVAETYITQVVAYLTQIWDLVSSKKAWTLRSVYMAIADVIVFIESISRETRALSGKQRRDAAVRALNQVINIPILPEALEKRLFGVLVDAVVQTLNRFLGHDWLNRVYNLNPGFVGVPPVDLGLPANELVDFGVMGTAAAVGVGPGLGTVIPIEGAGEKAADGGDDQTPGSGEGDCVGDC